MKLEKFVIDRISTLKDLPSLPHILMKLMAACNDENGSLGDIADILTNDPSLCAKVLRMVNSAYYGLGSRVDGIDQAVAYLGTDAVKNIAVCSAVYQAFNTRKGDSAFNLKLFWWHSLKCALLSRIFAKEVAYGRPEEAFVAGLLHDIGKLVLWVNFPEKYTELIKQYEDRAEMLATGESQLGATHSQIGAWLLDRWKFPSLVADSAFYHHEPLERIADALPLSQIVYTANMLSGKTADSREDGIRVAKALLGSSSEQVLGFLALSDEALGEVARSFGIEIEAPQEIGENPSDTDRKVQENLVREVRDISLLLGTIRNLVAAQEEKEILKVLHEGLQILFDIRHILFFLYDDEKDILVGKEVEGHQITSRANDLTISMGLEKSLLVSCLLAGKALDSFSLGQSSDLVITDAQMIRFMKTDGMLCLPLALRSEYVGVVVVGLDSTKLSHLGRNFKLLEMFLSEATLTLRLEQLRERQLRRIQSERAGASFDVARKVVHEVNNPLGIMKNYLKILGVKLKEQGIELDELGVLNEEIDRIALIVGGLTAFSRETSRKWAPVDINALIDDLVKLTAESLLKEKKVAIQADLDPKLPKLMSDRGGLRQILVNLMNNASEAMMKGGNIYFKTRYRSAPLEGSESRGLVEVTVSDDGPGIPEEMKKRVFEPFVSSKGSGHSGLGLSIVLNLINGLKGNIVCQSEEGKGTRFKIEFPVGK
ncbi:MAG: HDOD domain-containing protein [Desulfobacteraceae bacterium]|jgi:HD-like signal output (HDOD) protein/nitrogen-specific signal transduction histidine kinase|nr:HDOD domain-containing protein [Desulfobacteraceae bacterium]